MVDCRARQFTITEEYDSGGVEAELTMAFGRRWTVFEPFAVIDVIAWSDASAAERNAALSPRAAVSLVTSAWWRSAAWQVGDMAAATGYNVSGQYVLRESPVAALQNAFREQRLIAVRHEIDRLPGTPPGPRPPSPAPPPPAPQPPNPAETVAPLLQTDAAVVVRRPYTAAERRPVRLSTDTREGALRPAPTRGL
jgi:hypothetical protein